MKSLKVFFCGMYTYFMFSWAGLDDDYPALLAIPLAVAILAPCYGVSIWTWKQYRFLGLPTPLQLLKGLSRQWHTVKKGHVVTRVHLPKPPSSPTP